MENSKPAVRTPSIKRRLSIMVYDALLLLAVELLAVLLYLAVTPRTHSAWTDAGSKFVVILAAAAYFIQAWTSSGHTLAMKTWRVKLVMVGYPKIPVSVAVRRFVYAWGWFAPAAIVIHSMHLTHFSLVALWVLLVNIALWAATAWLDPNRQFLHDRLAGTRLIELPKKTRAPAPAQGNDPEQATAG